MITYDYRCPNCGAHCNLRSPSDHETPVCFHCDTPLVLVLHPPEIAFVEKDFTATTTSTRKAVNREPIRAAWKDRSTSGDAPGERGEGRDYPWRGVD